SVNVSLTMIGVRRTPIRVRQFLALHLIRRFSGGAGALGWYPSLMTSKSLAVNDWNAGFNTSLFQRMSYVPLTYRSDPLSATMSPYRCMARKIFWISGV